MKLQSHLVLALFGTAAKANTLRERQMGPSVTIRDGTVVGSTSDGIESFKGIPYADPPVGSLRLRPPQALSKPFGTMESETTPTACPQMDSLIDTAFLPVNVVALLVDLPFLQTATTTGEDCLTINVQRPAGTTANSSLPVVFWIFGGGFEFGSTQTYDGSRLLRHSVKLNKPVIYVAVNYRVGGFGFLAGNDLTDEGSTNLGLRDQRLGLQWVRDNIAAFGGDPDKVTIWGESAGSFSVAYQMLVNGGDNKYKGKPLFRGGIMDSGAVLPTTITTSTTPQDIYATVLDNAGCSNATDRLDCLRQLDYTTYLNAVNSLPGLLTYRGLAIVYVPRPDPTSKFFSLSPEVAVEQEKFAKIPIIIGDQEDEGTAFCLVQENITTTQDMIDYMGTLFPTVSRSTATKLVNAYPANPADGSPFGTGPLNNIYPQYKRLAALLGDKFFTLTRRFFLERVSAVVPSWSYLASYFYGTPVLGTFHASDLLGLYYGAGPPIPTNAIMTYYVSFINTLNPNSLAGAQLSWPKWNKSTKKLMHFNALGSEIIPDTFRPNQYNAIKASISEVKF